MQNFLERSFSFLHCGILCKFHLFCKDETSDSGAILFNRYEGLKPPTSPSPSATTPEKPVDEKPESHSEPKAKPLSPYAM